jgi:hypothetical protein
LEVAILPGCVWLTPGLVFYRSGESTEFQMKDPNKPLRNTFIP